jgi:PAS domain S-box-containing protein
LFLLGAAHEVYQATVAEQEEAGRNAKQLAAITAADAERFIGESEQMLARVAQRSLVRAMDSKRCDPLFREFRDLLPRYENITTADLGGNLVCTAVPTSDEGGIQLDLRDSTERMARDPRFVVGKIKPGATKGKWILPLSYPVRAEDGKLSGLVTVSVDLDRFPPLAARARGPDQTVVAIDDGEGTVVGRRTEPDKSGEQGAEARKPSTTKVRNADGYERIYSYLPVVGTEWKALVGIPTEKLGGRALAAALRYALLGAAILALMIVATLYLRRRIDQPIARLVKMARDVGSGQTHVRVADTDAAEFAEVGREFNTMLEALAHDRKTAEEVQVKLQEVLREAGAVVYSTAPGRDRILFISTTAERVYGRSADEFYANASLWLDSVHEDDREAVQAQYKQLLRGGAFDTEYRIMRPDGSLRWLHDRAWLIIDEASRPARIDGFVLDVSSRKQVDLTLRNSLQHFRAIAEASPVPLCIISSPEGLIRYANDAFLQAFDVSREDCISQELAGLFANREDHTALLQRLTREGNVEAEVPLRRHDGKILWVNASTRLATYDKEPAVYVALYDVTARKQAEHSLRASEERFRTLIAALSEGMVMLDAAGRIVSCNAAAEEILGVKREQLLGLMLGSPRWQPIREDGSPLSRQSHPAAVTLANGKPQRDAIVGVRRADGKQIWLSFNAEPQFHPDSTRPYAAIVSFMDVTARRLAEKPGSHQEVPAPAADDHATSATEAVITIDSQHCITFFNHLAQHMFGFDAGSMLGRHLNTLVAERDRKALVEHLATVGFASRTTLPLAGLRPNGEEIALEARVSRRNFADHEVFTIMLHYADASAAGKNIGADRKRRAPAPIRR